MAIVGSKGYLPISLGTPGLVSTHGKHLFRFTLGSLNSKLVDCLGEFPSHNFRRLRRELVLLQVGLGLSYAAPIVSSLSRFLTSFTETEKEMVSVERVLQVRDKNFFWSHFFDFVIHRQVDCLPQYMDIPQEESRGSLLVRPDWPFRGHIEFEHVTLRYKPMLPAALNDVSFNISAGMQVSTMRGLQFLDLLYISYYCSAMMLGDLFLGLIVYYTVQVGIVGRTGAGKSSIINALFRLTPICNGRILVDGLDVADVAVRDLRGRFAVVPQSPFLSEGSLRYCLYN